MSDAPGPPPIRSSMLRNIIVGVTTTVLGSSAVYFLGFNHKNNNSPNNYLVTKEATTKAWRSYVAIDNIYYKNLMSLSKDPEMAADLDNYEKEMFKEAARFKQDAETILKDDDIDKSFVTILNRRFEREKESQEYLSQWFEKVKSIKNSSQSGDEKKQRFMAELTKFQNYSRGALERASNEVEDLSKALSERYGQTFNLNEFMFYADYKKGLINKDSANQNNNGNITNQGSQESNNNNNNNSVDPNNQNNTAVNNPNNLNQPKEENKNNQFTSGPGVNPNKLAGNWTTNGAAITLGKDGAMEWYVLSNDDIATGTWKFSNNQLHMYATNNRTKQQANWIFNLSNVTANSFTMTLSVQPYNTYYMVRSAEDE